MTTGISNTKIVSHTPLGWPDVNPNAGKVETGNPTRGYGSPGPIGDDLADSSTQLREPKSDGGDLDLDSELRSEQRVRADYRGATTDQEFIEKIDNALLHVGVE